MTSGHVPRIAFQGEPGAFSDDAARTLVAGAETVGYGTFDDAATAAQHGETEFALLPVENSISGAVPRVYDLLWDDPRLVIVDEIVYRVVQNLIGLPAATIEGIREVHSHPVALEQCRHFLGEHAYMRSLIVADTAGAVREIMHVDDPSIGAIGSALAAERYGARILAPSIQDVDDNFTRFFLLQVDGTSRNEPSRACVAFTLPHRPGSLRDALAAFADNDLNLRTLASRPSLEGPFTYRFYLEVAPVKRPGLEAALRRLDGRARVLGFY
ncbi:MAG: prephenate dehydratase [Vulcanimicrobiaceae bacterium]